ncbi:MAG: hypothetical protein U0X76_09655 [Bacteroidia bacterium]
MSRFLHTILALLIFAQSVSTAFVLAGYELNRSYISKNLCENKSKPSLHCNGKCHLKKELQKETDDSGNGSVLLKEKYEWVTFSNKNNSIAAILISKQSFSSGSPVFSILSGYIPGVLRPPAC